VKPRDKRALLLGGAAVLSAVLILRAIPYTWHTFAEKRATLQSQAELLERSRWEIRQAPVLEDSGLVIRGKVKSLAPRILSGGQQAAALADMTSRLKSAARLHRVRVERTSLVPDSAAAGGLRRVSLRAGMEADSRGTLGLLGVLARGPVVMTPTELRITASNPSGSAAEALKVEMTIAGWYLSQGEPTQ
jgi:hypothetical protein